MSLPTSSQLVQAAPPELLPSDLLAGLCGALLGGGISVVTTWFFARRVERDSRLLAAVALALRVHRLADNVAKAHLHIEAAVVSAPDGRISGVLRPIIGFSSKPVEFEPQELAILALRGDAEFMQRLLEAAAFHNLLMEVLGEYNWRRQDLDAELRVNGQVEVVGDEQRTTLSAETMSGLRPKFLEVEGLAQQLLRLVREGRAETLDIATASAHRIRRALNDKRFDIELHYGSKSGPDVKA